MYPMHTWYSTMEYIPAERIEVKGVLQWNDALRGRREFRHTGITLLALLQ